MGWGCWSLTSFEVTSQCRIVNKFTADKECSFFDNKAEHFVKNLGNYRCHRLAVRQKGVVLWYSGKIFQINFEQISYRTGLEYHFESDSAKAQSCTQFLCYYFKYCVVYHTESIFSKDILMIDSRAH